MEAVGSVSSRDLISQTGVVRYGRDARHFDSNLQSKFISWWGAAVESWRRSSKLPARVCRSVNAPQSRQQRVRLSRNQSRIMRSERMSTLSEQDHLNPRDPRYYAPRWLREKSRSHP